jgi:hypothetical protein
MIVDTKKIATSTLLQQQQKVYQLNATTYIPCCTVWLVEVLNENKQACIVSIVVLYMEYYCVRDTHRTVPS